MLRVTIELLPGGRADRARVIGRAIIGQTAKGPGTLREYGAVLWDDWASAPTTTTAEHDRLAGVWKLVATMIQARDEPRPPLPRQEQALLQRLNESGRSRTPS